MGCLFTPGEIMTTAPNPQDDKELLELAARAASVVNRARVDGKPLLDPTGERFGRLTVLHEVPRKSPRKRRFLCRCDCDATVEVDLNKMRTGHTKSCGCLHLEARARNIESAPRNGSPKHGMNKTPEHMAWVSMKQRCTNSRKREWPHYGGRGIRVCERWMNSFDAFFSDVGPRPSTNHSIDRIDVNGHYEPGNCRWATQQEQVENTRVARLVTINGKTQTISSWEREMALSKGQVRAREVAGWSLEEAILTPSIKGQKLNTATRRAIVRAAAALARQESSHDS